MTFCFNPSNILLRKLFCLNINYKSFTMFSLCQTSGVQKVHLYKIDNLKCRNFQAKTYLEISNADIKE